MRYKPAAPHRPLPKPPVPFELQAGTARALALATAQASTMHDGACMDGGDSYVSTAVAPIVGCRNRTKVEPFHAIGDEGALGVCSITSPRNVQEVGAAADRYVATSDAVEDGGRGDVEAQHLQGGLAGGVHERVSEEEEQFSLA